MPKRLSPTASSHDAAPTATERERAMTGYVRCNPSQPETGISAKWRKMCASIPMPEQRPAVRGRRSHCPTTTVPQANATKPTNSTGGIVGRSPHTNQGSAANYHLLEDRFKQGETKQLERGDFCLFRPSAEALLVGQSLHPAGRLLPQQGDEFKRGPHGRETLQATIRPTTTASSTKLQPASVN